MNPAASALFFMNERLEFELVMIVDD